MRLHLIGGGRDRDAVHASHAPFVDEVLAAGDRPIVVYVLDEGEHTDPERWRDVLTGAGAAEVRVQIVSPARGPRPEDFEGAGGAFVAGGWTPGYRDALVAGGLAWLDRMRDDGLPYAGFSAGAAIAAEAAIVGGWCAEIGGEIVPVCPEDAGEELEAVTVRDGLGLIDFCVDVHAAQWGTLARLVHALPLARRSEGWAIDEGTVLVVDETQIEVRGVGAAHRVRLGADQAAVLSAHPAGAVVPRSA